MKEPEELAPDYPEFVFVVRGPNGELPIQEFSDGTAWVLSAIDAHQLAKQGVAMNQIGMTPSTNLFVFDNLRDLVADQIPHATGIAVLDSREECANLIYTR